VDNLHDYLQNITLYVVAVKLRVQQVLPDLVERREAVSGNRWVAMKNGGCDSCQFSSVDGVCIAHTMWFKKVGSRNSRVVFACTCHLFSLINLAAAVCVCPLLPVRNFLTKCGLNSVGIILGCG